MAAEVLRPHDVLANGFGVHPTPFHRRRVMPATGNVNNIVVSRKQHRKTSPPKPDKRRHNATPAAAPEARKSSRRQGGAPNSRRRVETPTDVPLAMGKVTIQRRGEPLSSIGPRITGGNPSSPLSNPVDVPSVRKQIHQPPAQVYAGSAFSLSPSPRSVPMPSFFNRKDSYDGATRDLRRLLRLE